MKSVSKMLDWIDDNLCSPAATDYTQIHEMAHEIEAEVENKYMRLPLDANNELIHVGDRLIDDYDALCVVVAVSEKYVCFTRCVDGVEALCMGIAKNHRLYHKPTVEDVLADMLDAWGELPSNATNETIITEYADKLREMIGDE